MNEQLEPEKILKKVYDFFVMSNDFNGIPLTRLADELNYDYKTMLPTIKNLIIEESLSIQNGDNPHIIRFAHYTTEGQLKLLKDAENNVVTYLDEKMETSDLGFNISFESHLICAYPSKKYLDKHRRATKYNKSPFSKRLAFGDPHLTAVFFELDVLERYYSDPRYDFQFDDYSGSISIVETEKQRSQLKEQDQIFLKTFGLGFDLERQRVVVVYLRYLSDLTSEHQNFWKTKQIDTQCKIVKEYYQNTVEGNWSFGQSLFSAVTEEQRLINLMTEKITGKKLFKRTYEDENRPKEFTFFTSPTLVNYERFVGTLDKMISDNIDKKFFKGLVEEYELNPISDSVVEKNTKGTIRLLEEWIRKSYKLVNEEGYEYLFKPFKNLRKKRQNPAHKISKDYYDKSFYKLQMDLLKEIYYSMNGLRSILQQHPLVQDIEIPEWIKKGAIKEF